MSDGVSETIAIDEIARTMKCSEQTVLDELRSGNWPGLKAGRDWIVPRAAFFQRINEIALDRSEQLRLQRAAPAPTRPVTPSGRTGRRRRALPSPEAFG